jgi:hypothetical protein
MDKLAKAMGLKDVVWGEAFDPEVQERKKQERIAAREAEKARKQQEWEERWVAQQGVSRPSSCRRARQCNTGRWK